jgi:hypothetical protein
VAPHLNTFWPQFSAVFSDWDFAPRIAEPPFTPKLPAGTQKIPFETVTAAISSATAPARSIRVRVVFILYAPASYAAGLPPIRR